jgi:hypothetical protein
MTSLWFLPNDAETSDDDPRLGIFVARPSEIAAMLPRPRAPFVYFPDDRRVSKFGVPSEDSSDSVGYESPVAIPSIPRDREAISLF